MQSWCACSEKNTEMNFMRKKMKHYTMKKKCQPSKTTNVSKEGIIKLNVSVCTMLTLSVKYVCMRQCLTDFCCSFLSSLHLCKTNYCSNRPLLTTLLTLLCCSPCRLAKVRLNVVGLQTGMSSQH
jgi:hypothetical protein